MNNSSIHRLSLLELQSMLQESNAADVHAFVGRNVGIVNRIHPRLFSNLLSHPIFLSERRVIILRKGWAKATVNLIPVTVQANELNFLASNSTIQLHEVSPDAEGMGFTMTDEMFLLATDGHVPPTFDGHLRQFKLKLSDKEMAFAERFIDMLYTARQQKDYSSQMFFNLAAAFWWYIDSLCQVQAAATSDHADRNQQLFANFIALVNQHARREHNLAFYADKLFLSQRYMSTLVKQVSGRSAKEWIDEALVTAIKVELRHSNKPMKQISEEFCFANTSFFSKFFKSHTGTTPKEYRDERNQG